MTIMVDDAGWGDLLGGVVVACFREETEQFTYRMIGIKFFKDPTFDEKLYLNETSRLVQEMLQELKVDRSEPVKLCTGYVLSRTYLDLRRAGYNVTIGKITGPLQELGEQAFLNELRKIGYEPLPNREADGRMRAKSFYHMLNWARADPKRMEFAKTGWRFFTGKPKRQWNGQLNKFGLKTELFLQRRSE